jgi:hypothetical protein
MPRARCQARRSLLRCQTEKPTVKHLSKLDREAIEEEIRIFLPNASYEEFLAAQK